MNYKLFISFAAFILFVSISVVSGPGCANIIPPEGGLRDSLAPVLTKSNPRDSTLNFEGNKVVLTFDEYVQIDNFQQNVLVSPIGKSAPRYNLKLNTLTVRLSDSLEPNTTYSINFGNAIKDYNEGNIMRDYTYVFSTGPTIDNHTFSGNVVMAESGKTDTTLIVILHRNGTDSAVMKERPRYMAKLDGKGAFTFRNLPTGTFYVYAMKDDARIFRYQGPKQIFAFADSPVVVQDITPSKTLYAYEGVKPSSTSGAAGTATQNAADKRIKFQTTINNNKHDLLKKFSFYFEKPLRKFDSTKIHFVTDTLYTPLTGYSWATDSTKKIVTLNYTWQPNTLYHLILERDFATDTLGQRIARNDTLSFITMKTEEYGQVEIRFRNLDLSKNPVIQFVQSDAVVGSFPLTAATFSQPLFLPGEYELRLLNDINKNGVWDPGEFIGKHRQPEIAKPINRKVNVKANWENQFEIAL